MPTFDFTAPDGKTYSVNGPEGATAEQAFAILQSQIGKKSPPAAAVPAAGPSMLADVAKSAGTGVVKGAIGLAGMPGDIAHALYRAGQWAGDKLGLPSLPEAADKAFRNTLPVPPSKITENVEALTAPLYEPKTTVGEYAQTVGEFLPAAAAGPGGIARRVAMQAMLPAVASETAGQLTKGTEAEPYARFAGAVASPFAVSAARRAMTPLPIDSARAVMADTLRREGVGLTAGQRSGSDALRYAESTLGDAPFAGGKASGAYERQAEQFTRAALAKAGETADRATPEVMRRMSDRIGAQFDDLATRNTAVADPQFIVDLQADWNGYKNLVSAPNRVPAVENFAREVIDQLKRNANSLPGNVYQSLRSRMEAAARSITNTEARNAIRDMRTSLDGLMERSIAKANPDDLGAWRDARRQYRNMMILEQAAASAGENAALGLISPRALRQAAATGRQGRRGYVRGQGDFADLARAGNALMLPMPQSGSAPRVLMSSGGALLGSALAGEPFSLAALAGIAAPGAFGRALMSRPVQSYLSSGKNTGALNGGLPARQNALLQALLAPSRIAPQSP